MRLYPLRLVSDKTNINFMGKKWISFSISIALIILSFICLGIKGLNYGIDFSGGILIEAKMDPAPNLSTLREKLTHLDIGEVSLQNFGSANDVMIRVGMAKGENAEASQMKTIELIKNTIANSFPGKIEYRKIDFVGPQVGMELIKNSSLAIILSCIGIMAYIWFRFEWQYGVGIIFALVHDAITTLGFISLLQLEFNLTSIAAILAVIGYSVNDSVVIYDRIRENMRRFKQISINEMLNTSINETLSRTTLTVLTTLLATLALILYGGEVIKSFSVTVFFGIVIGTYSSIYISAPVLVYFGLGRKPKKDKE
jgi:preprotein translocase subunit SecF